MDKFPDSFKRPKLNQVVKKKSLKLKKKKKSRPRWTDKRILLDFQ